MPSRKEISDWLEVVNNARVAVNRAMIGEVVDHVDASFDLRQADDYLERCWRSGLLAHGRAVIEEYLAEEAKRQSAA